MDGVLTYKLTSSVLCIPSLSEEQNGKKPDKKNSFMLLLHSIFRLRL